MVTITHSFSITFSFSIFFYVVFISFRHYFLFLFSFFPFSLYFSRNCCLYFFLSIFSRQRAIRKRMENNIPSVFLINVDMESSSCMLVLTEAYNNRYVLVKFIFPIDFLNILSLHVYEQLKKIET